jgi:hypothetical protein
MANAKSNPNAECPNDGKGWEFGIRHSGFVIDLAFAIRISALAHNPTFAIFTSFSNHRSHRTDR